MLRRSLNRRFLGAVAVSLVIFSLLGWYHRHYLLTQIASIWIISETPAKADAIIILGGGEQTRPFKAAELYRAGLAPVILIPKINPLPTEQLSLALGSNELNRRVLLSQGVPESAIQLIGDGEVKNTRDEASKAAKWLKAHHAHTLIIPTDAFHTRRCRWIFRRTLQPVDARACVVSARSFINASNWWTTEEGVVTFENEICKMIYYWLKY